MLRLFILLLLLANGTYFAWAEGLLAPAGFVPTRQTEPERVAQQIRPEALRLMSGDDARRMETAGGARAPECLQTGLLEDPQAVAVRQVLDAGWPVGAWTMEPSVEPARWMIYMGRYADNDALNRKKAELRNLQVLFQTLPNPAMEPGISLGSFDRQESANQQLAALARRGVRTARVVQERAEARGQVLRLTSLDDALRARLPDLRDALGGRALRACR